MKNQSNPKTSSLPASSGAHPSTAKTTVTTPSSRNTAFKAPSSNGSNRGRSAPAQPKAAVKPQAAAHRPAERPKPAAPGAFAEDFKQDKLTLFAFYALLGSVLAGVLYFLSLLFFI